MPEAMGLRHARWKQLRDFIAHWYTPITVGDGVRADELAAIEQRNGITMPQALREWYQIAGKRRELTSGQNEFRTPDTFGTRIDGEYVILYVENQDVCRWGIRLRDLALEDPPVFLSDDVQGTWILETTTLSEFIFQVVVFEASIETDTYGRHGLAEVTLDNEMIELLQWRFDKLHLSSWHWPADNSIFCVTDETIIFYEGVILLLVVTKQQQTFTELESLIKTKFEYPEETGNPL
jgi:hypothetical protein